MEQPQALSNDTQAAQKIKERIVQANPTLAGEELNVSVSKGMELQNRKKEGAAEDVVQVTLEHSALKDSKRALAIASSVSAILNKIDAISNSAIMLPPENYLEQEQKKLGELLEIARTEKIKGSEADYTKSMLFSPNLSEAQKDDHATQVIDNPSMTMIRINIPTNPKNREAAETLAQRVEADVKQRLPEIKAAMIERIKRKNYIPDLTPEKEKQLQGHEFHVTTQQQADWTSVFIEIRSPEQKDMQEHPEKAAKADPEALKNTNMLMQISDEANRFKIAARAGLFMGPDKEQQPASYFFDVAGSQNIKASLTKVMEDLKKKRTDLAPRIDALLNENFLKPTREWNIPPTERSEHKHTAHIYIDPDHSDQMKIKLCVPNGKADEIIEAIAKLPINQASIIDIAPKEAPQPGPADAPAAPVVDTSQFCGCDKAKTGVGAQFTPAAQRRLDPQAAAMDAVKDVLADYGRGVA